MGLKVSKLATQDEIKKMEVFQVNGQFDINRYKQILSQNRMTPVSFEAYISCEMIYGPSQFTIISSSVLDD